MMKLVQRWITAFLQTFNLLPGTPSVMDDALQQPLGSVEQAEQTKTASFSSPPVFQPPNSGNEFQCNYSIGHPGWKACTTPQDRGCWLRGPNGQEFSISTDYEKITPVGVTRYYELEVSNTTLAPDGFKNLRGKVFNNMYPGPWLQACWGDYIEIKVTNRLPNNGTTIHWHGIRQNGTLDMDGVNGVTQCPIATNDSFTYKFRATQYGTSWYHSHYSLQYADGLLGPLTIYGPSTSNYDEAKEPILMTDWNHRSAFEDFFLEMSGKPPNMTSSLMNGRGYYKCTSQEQQARNCTEPPKKYSTTFKEGKKYLLRLINTSVDSTWIFSIDGHDMQVIGIDFVPIKPYITNHVLVGIGQRYHVAIEATRPLPDINYWIRMTVAQGCSGFPPKPDDKIGILRYDENNSNEPKTTSNKFDPVCADEPYDKLIPFFPWKIGKPANERMWALLYLRTERQSTDTNAFSNLQSSTTPFKSVSPPKVQDRHGVISPAGSWATARCG